MNRTVEEVYDTWGDLRAKTEPAQYPIGYFGGDGSTGADGTLDDPLLKKFVNHAAVSILKRTNGTVKPSDIVLRLGMETARRLTNTRELRAYLAQAPQLEMIPGVSFPSHLFGLRTHVFPDVSDWQIKVHAGLGPPEPVGRLTVLLAGIGYQLEDTGSYVMVGDVFDPTPTAEPIIAEAKNAG